MGLDNRAVKWAIIQNLGMDGSPEQIALAEKQIANMPKSEQWERYCNWNGFINWSNELHIAHEAIYGK